MGTNFFLRRIWIVLALLALMSGAILGATELPPDTWEARRQVTQAIFGPISSLALIRPRLLQAEASRVQFSVEPRGGSFYLLFLHQQGFRAGEPAYPLRGAGNTSIKRRIADGSIEFMTIMLRDDTRNYLRLYPAGNRTRLDLVLYGVTVHQGIMLSSPIDRLVTAPLQRVVDLTEQRVDWDLVLQRGHPDQSMTAVIEGIRRALPNLLDEEDGAYDELGRPVLIKTGEPSDGGMNCSGFAKWVIDGLYYPLVGRYMSIERLKRKNMESRGTRWTAAFEGERDPYFGLDWSRNMVGLIEEARSNRSPNSVEFADVRRVPYLSYIEDVGYHLDDLELLLFLLARRRPGQFYLGSINRDYGENPILHQHTHVVTLFPTFTDQGEFRVIVMERNLETGLESLRARYSGSYIHLVSIQAGVPFTPLTLPPKADKRSRVFEKNPPLGIR